MILRLNDFYIRSEAWMAAILFLMWDVMIEIGNMAAMLDLCKELCDWSKELKRAVWLAAEHRTWNGKPGPVLCRILAQKSDSSYLAKVKFSVNCALYSIQSLNLKPLYA